MFSGVQVRPLVPLADTVLLWKVELTAPGETVTLVGWLELLPKLVYKLPQNKGNAWLHLPRALACSGNYCPPADCLHSWLLPCPAVSCSARTLSQPWHLDQGARSRAWVRDWDRPKVRKPRAGIWKKCRENKLTSIPFACFGGMRWGWGEVGAFMCGPKMATGEGEKEKHVVEHILGNGTTE